MAENFADQTLLSDVETSDELVVVRSGDTYRMTAGTIRSGLSGGGGGDSTTANVNGITLSLSGTTLTLTASRESASDLSTDIDLTTLEEWRGAWRDLSGQTIRAGDIVEHTGRYYISRVEHVRQQNGPDTQSANYALINNWGGTFDASGYYHAGSIVLYSGNLWVNSEDVLASDPNPDLTTNTKWHRLSPFSGTEIATLLEGLTGDDRLDASTLRNFPVATAAQAGVIEIASNTEADTGTDSARAMTPATVRRQTGTQVTPAERSANTPETSVRRFSPADIVAMIGAHATAGGLSSDEVLALFATWARVADTSRIPAAKLDTSVVLTNELTTAIADFRTETQIDNLITTALAGLDAVTNAGVYDNATAYEAGALVRHGGNGTQATYLCIVDAPASVPGSEPGVGTDWENSWYRVGYEDGPPNAITGASASGRTVTFTRESGRNPLEVNFPVTDRSERGERITFQAVAAGDTDAEAQPIATNPLSVVHGDGANSILSNVSGNDVTVAAGLYIVKVQSMVTPGGNTGQQRDQSFRIDIRNASDNSVLAQTTSPSLVGTAAQRASAIALVDLDADTAINHYIDRSQLAIAANWTITYYRWGENEDTGVGNVRTVELGRYTVATDQSSVVFADTGVAAPTDIDPEDTFLFTYEEELIVANLDFSGRQLLAAERREAGSTAQSGTLELSTVSDSYNISRNAAGNFVIAAFNDQLYANQTYIFEILRAPRGERGPAGGWGPPTDIGTATFDLDGTAQQVALTDSGSEAIVCPADGYIIAIISIPTLSIVGQVTWVLAADLRDARANTAISAGLYTNTDNEILLGVGAQSGASTGNEVIIQHIGSTTDETDASASPVIRPSIARFDVTGDLTPDIGSIAGDVYNYSLAISQSGHASAARIVGFAGTSLTPSSVAVLATVSDLHSETGTVTIPAGTRLASAGDTYTIRLEVYTQGETPATDNPRIYHDARIVAHAQTATVHFGTVLSTEGAADADFATDDILTRGATAGSYTVSGIPSDTNLYRVYWAVPQSLAQPTSWTTSGFDVTSTIDDAVARTVGGVAYNFYLSEADSPYDSSGNGLIYMVST